MIPRVKARKESALESWCVKWARCRQIPVAKLMECAGMPDRIFFTPGGRPLVPEFKRPDGKGERRPAQVWYVARLKELGYAAEFVDSKEGFMELMRGRGVK